MSLLITQQVTRPVKSYPNSKNTVLEVHSIWRFKVWFWLRERSARKPPKPSDNSHISLMNYIEADDLQSGIDLNWGGADTFLAPAPEK